LLQSQLETSEEKRKDIEKEQEDLLVLLDEVTSKRRKDKVRLREANLEVSEDEAEDDGDEDEYSMSSDIPRPSESLKY
jgi:intracellular protein transport protein USO1